MSIHQASTLLLRTWYRYTVWFPDLGRRLKCSRRADGYRVESHHLDLFEVLSLLKQITISVKSLEDLEFVMGVEEGGK